MKAAIATGTENIDAFIRVEEDWPKPTLDSAVDGKTGKKVSELIGKENDRRMIVKVLACALAPGDCRLFTGKTDMVQLPKSGRPYVIGSDICGIVHEVASDEPYYDIGDRVVCRFDEPQPHGMCAEYACVKTSLSEKCPNSIPAVEACTLPASAAAARLVAQKFVAPGSRVLLLGASGGLGTFFCQYAKLEGASYLAATTTQVKLVRSLGVDRAIDYRTENWWELEDEFQDMPFDLVVDLVNGKNWRLGACSGTKVLKYKDKDGSRTVYAQLLTGVQTEIDMTGCGMVSFMLGILGRSLYSKLWRSSCPEWIAPQGLDLHPGDLKAILEDVGEKRIRVVLDPTSPFPFDTEGVRLAMNKQWSKHAHGKVVIEIAKEDGS